VPLAANARSEVDSFYSPLYDQKEAAAITAAMSARASEAYNAHHGLRADAAGASGSLWWSVRISEGVPLLSYLCA
jgi:hypothetical protein